jgi:hypothetical protein
MLSQYFDPNKSFLNLKIFWFVIALMSSAAALIFIIIYINTPMHLDLSADGFSGFIDIFKFPLSLLALIIPIVVLLASNHRSEQTKKQIEIATSQNIFQNHYKHIEEFSKYINQVSAIEVKTAVIHRMIFPNSVAGTYDSCENLINNYKSFIIESLTKLSSFSSDEMLLKQRINEIRKDCIKNLSNMGFEKKSLEKFEAEETISFMGEAIRANTDIYPSLYSILVLLIKPLVFLDKYYYFSLNYETTTSTAKIINFDFHKHITSAPDRLNILTAEICELVSA